MNVSKNASLQPVKTLVTHLHFTKLFLCYFFLLLLLLTPYHKEKNVCDMNIYHLFSSTPPSFDIHSFIHAEFIQTFICYRKRKNHKNVLFVVLYSMYLLFPIFYRLPYSFSQTHFYFNISIYMSVCVYVPLWLMFWIYHAKLLNREKQIIPLENNIGFLWNEWSQLIVKIMVDIHC